MMRKIYSSASFVLVWLGPEADDSAIAMRVLDDMQIQGYTLLTLREERQRSQLNAMKKLFQRPYWTRVWVVQEFVLARELLLRSGDAGATYRQGHVRLFRDLAETHFRGTRASKLSLVYKSSAQEAGLQG